MSNVPAVDASERQELIGSAAGVSLAADVRDLKAWTAALFEACLFIPSAEGILAPGATEK